MRIPGDCPTPIIPGLLLFSLIQAFGAAQLELRCGEPLEIADVNDPPMTVTSASRPTVPVHEGFVGWMTKHSVFDLELVDRTDLWLELAFAVVGSNMETGTKGRPLAGINSERTGSLQYTGLNNSRPVTRDPYAEKTIAKSSGGLPGRLMSRPGRADAYSASQGSSCGQRWESSPR